MTETRIQSVGVQPAIERLPRPTTTIGAIARIGIVCEPTTYGISPRCRTRKLRNHRAEGEADHAADDEADERLLSGEERGVEEELRRRSCPSSCTGSKSEPTIDESDGIVMSSTVNGHLHPVARNSSR